MTEGCLGDPRVMNVAMQVKEGRDLSALILAEIVRGLDERRATRAVNYRGGVRLLQIWLMERLEVMKAINGDGEYCPGSVTSRNLRWARVENRSTDHFPYFVRSKVLKWDVQ